jgi:hypothetical protein
VILLFQLDRVTLTLLHRLNLQCFLLHCLRWLHEIFRFFLLVRTRML